MSLCVHSEQVHVTSKTFLNGVSIQLSYHILGMFLYRLYWIIYASNHQTNARKQVINATEDFMLRFVTEERLSQDRTD